MYLGNLDALRDWGHAKDYVRMQWMILQQDEPDDFVVATGQQISVRDFVRLAAKHLGIELEFRGSGVDERAIAVAVDSTLSPEVKVGDEIVRVDPRYFRPAEVETLLGDPTKAKEKLGWTPLITVEQMCGEMVRADLNVAKRDLLLRQHDLDESWR